VLWEWLNAFSDVNTRAIASEGYRRIHADSRIEVVSFDSELNSAVFELYRTRTDKNWSLTDCLSFVIMQRRRLNEALTTDGHFAQIGLNPLMISSVGL
jgi:predicted nucleic acid-binding protein